MQQILAFGAGTDPWIAEIPQAIDNTSSSFPFCRCSCCCYCVVLKHGYACAGMRASMQGPADRCRPQQLRR